MALLSVLPLSALHIPSRPWRVWSQVRQSVTRRLRKGLAWEEGSLPFAFDLALKCFLELKVSEYVTPWCTPEHAAPGNAALA